MSKISKSFKAIGAILKNPWLLNRVLEEDSRWRSYVKKKFGMEDGFPEIRPEDLFGDFHETVSPFAWLDGGSSPTDLALLKKLAKSVPGCSYFEIGTWRGESVANVAQVAQTCVTLNLAREEMAAIGLSQSYIDQHGMFSRNHPGILHIEGNTLDFDLNSLNRKFDLIFIDGDHRFEMVKNDTKKVFDSLVHDRTIVVWHDYTRQQESVRYEVMAGILEGCPANARKLIRHVAHTLCAVYFPVDHPGIARKPVQKPEGFFKIDIEYFKMKQ